MSQWSEIRNRLENKWQIPLLFVSVLLLIGAFIGGRPSPDDLPIDDAVRYMESLVKGGAFDGAAKVGEVLLAREDLTAAQRAPVLLQMARSRFGQAGLDGVTSGERGPQIQQ